VSEPSERARERDAAVPTPHGPMVPLFRYEVRGLGLEAAKKLAREYRAQRDELRAILAPLLDDPIEEDREEGGLWCKVCGGTNCREVPLEWTPPPLPPGVRYAPGYEPEPGPTSRITCDGDAVHEPDCPVLRRDALLGTDVDRLTGKEG
jgi:hypothetical protein